MCKMRRGENVRPIPNWGKGSVLPLPNSRGGLRGVGGYALSDQFTGGELYYLPEMSG